MKKGHCAIALVGLLVALIVWLRGAPGVSYALDIAPPAAEPVVSEPIRPLPAAAPLDAAKVALGGRLFADPRLSRDGSTACASCHDLDAGGAENKPVSIGIDGLAGRRNAPTVFNSGFNFKQFWDGRADSLEAQIDGPIHAPEEMGSGWPEIIPRLEADAAYRAAFGAAYAGRITAASIRDAIATFERSLSTESRFDRYLRGDPQAVTLEELRGYQLFKAYGCISCHQGVNVGGNLFQKMGVMADYFAPGVPEGTSDLGRFAITGLEEDRHVFKVPGLRNVTRTAPYFHDGSVPTLALAIATMAKFQLGRELSPEDVQLIAAFLGTLDAAR